MRSVPEHSPGDDEHHDPSHESDRPAAGETNHGERAPRNQQLCDNCERNERVAYRLTTYLEEGDGVVDLHFCSAACLRVWT